MSTRVNTLCQKNFVVISTFHSLCLKILRKYYGLFMEDTRNKNFKICTPILQRRIIKEILENQKVNTEEYPTKLFISMISEAKNKLKSPSEFKCNSAIEKRIILPVYEEYENELRRRNLLDFDDLLLKCKQLFDKNIQLKKKISTSIHYLLVDEFQDTNQVRIIFNKFIN